MIDTAVNMPLWFLVGSAFVIGASVGSFLNVVIARVPFGESIVWPPSHCRSCGKGIEPFHNVPILSWFLLRGRCSNCLARFSFRYAFIELAFALICAFAVARHGVGWAAAREIVLMGFLLPLAMIDLDTWLLPSELTYSGTVVGLLLTLPMGRDVFLEHLLAAAVAYTGLMLLGAVGERLLGKEAIGRGDLGLVALIGAFLGLKALFPVLLLSSVQGSLIGVVMIAARRRRGGEPAGEEPQREGDPLPETASAVTATVEQTPAPVVGLPEPEVAAAPVGAGLTVVAQPVEDDWKPDPTAIPFGPFLALAAAEVLYFSRLPDILLPL